MNKLISLGPLKHHDVKRYALQEFTLLYCKVHDTQKVVELTIDIDGVIT